MKKLDYLDIGLEVEVDGVKAEAWVDGTEIYWLAQESKDWFEINLTGYKEVLGIWMRQVAKLGKWKIRR